MEPVDEDGKRVFKATPGYNYFPWGADDVNYIRRTAQDLYALIERNGQGVGLRQRLRNRERVEGGLARPLSVRLESPSACQLARASAGCVRRVSLDRG